MIKQVLTLSLALLSLQNGGDGNSSIWDGQTNEGAQSVEVTGHAVGSGMRDALMKTLSRRQLTPDEINRQQMIKRYGLATILAWEVTDPTPTDDDPSFRAFASVYIPLEFPSSPSSGLVTISDVAHLGIDGGNVSLQPSRGWAYVNKPLYLQSSTKPVTKETTILGTAVTITATPTSYTWHCGDGHSFTTKDGGGTWPNGTVTCSYTRSGSYTLSADITWRASYTVNGNTYPVDGTLTTTSTVQTIEIREAEAVLKN
ncbi:MAG: hypothetical protein IKS49_08015 [Actinomycetaceae bacterium]|nr:hypothetical protein [Actinomycetaceae bacterium]